MPVSSRITSLTPTADVDDVDEVVDPAATAPAAGTAPSKEKS